MPVVTVSVVIPTRDRPLELERCLAAVRRSDGIELELIVVDDGSRFGDRISAIADAADAVYVRFEGAGPAVARNAGVAACTGEIVLFIDDDCVPDPQWASRLAQSVANERTAIVGGDVVLPARPTAWLRASERIAQGVEESSGLVRTCNLGCQRSLLIAVTFDERFPAAAGEDRDWCVRAQRHGATIRREPTAIVVHHADPGLRRFLQQQVRYGRGVCELRRRGTHVPMRPVAQARMAMAGFSEGLGVGLAVLIAQVATVVGYAHERLTARSG